MKLVGITLIRNGNLLKYPWKECIQNMLAVCDQVWVNCDPADDNTLDELNVMQEKDPRINVFISMWDMHNTGNGSELARQINVMLPYVTGDWILYLQADEFVHPMHKDILRNALEDTNFLYSQFELFRTYFWGDLQHRAPEYEIWLGRVFRPLTHEVGGDGMYIVKKSGLIKRVNVPIYHYSRMGTEEEITKRVRTLDGFFHEPEKVAEFEDFSYQEKKDLVEYKGPHPLGIEELYGKREE